MDLSNPLYVHTSDGPGSLPIQEKLIGAQNYRSWKRYMEIGLSTKRKLGFVKGTIPKPVVLPVTTENSVARATNATNIETWETCNNLMISWIMSFVCESIAKSVMFIGTASEIWSQLETRFSINNGSRKYNLSKDVFGISQQGVSFLNGLDDCYSSQRSQLLLINPLPSVENACAVIQQEKSRKDVFNFGLPMIELHCLVKVWEKTSVQFVVLNGILLISFGKKWAILFGIISARIRVGQICQDIKPGTSSGDCTDDELEFVADHMTPYCRYMINAKILEILPKITLPNGDSSKITQIGQVRLQKGIVLKDVLCVPTFKFSILSVLELTKDNNCVAIFFLNFCVIQDLRTRKVHGLGRKIRGMYHLLNVPIDQVDAKLRMEVTNITSLFSCSVGVIPSSVLNNKTPCEKLLNKVPDYSHLRVFGCFAVATNPSRVIDKFSPRDVPCTFIGYPAHQKGYKLYNFLTHASFNPTSFHMQAVKHLMRYLLNLPGQCIPLAHHSKVQLTKYCDSDWASCLMTRRSTTVYCILLDLGLKDLHPAILHCDNQAAIHIAVNLVFHARTKHIEVYFHYVRDQVKDGQVKPVYLHTSQQLADVFIKVLITEQHHYLLNKLGLSTLDTTQLEGEYKDQGCQDRDPT
nr:cysteine-rich RLK (receptor-like protein kinase) 8 [Tanacetum cinerariifolium]